MTLPAGKFCTIPAREMVWVIMPLAASEKATRVPPAALVTAMWVATLTYAVAQGLMYGTRSAIFMDVTNPAVAATQFTAYMAMMNLAISYSATWQGIAIEALGYPNTLLIDALTRLLCLHHLSSNRQPARPVMAAALLGHECWPGCWRWVVWPGCPSAPACCRWALRHRSSKRCSPWCSWPRRSFWLQAPSCWGHRPACSAGWGW
jgi:hypothetical protein